MISKGALAWRIPGTGGLGGCRPWGTASDATDATRRRRQRDSATRIPVCALPRARPRPGCAQCGADTHTCVRAPPAPAPVQAGAQCAAGLHVQTLFLNLEERLAFTNGECLTLGRYGPCYVIWSRAEVMLGSDRTGRLRPTQASAGCLPA